VIRAQDPQICGPVLDRGPRLAAPRPEFPFERSFPFLTTGTAVRSPLTAIRSGVDASTLAVADTGCTTRGAAAL
jgi:hypothetical protein